MFYDDEEYVTGFSSEEFVIFLDPKDKTPQLTGSVATGAGRAVHDLSLSIFVAFKVSMYSTSGLKVESLRIESEESQSYNP